MVQLGELYLNPRCRHHWNGWCGTAPGTQPNCACDRITHLFRRIHLRHQPCIRLCWSLHVLCHGIRDATPTGCYESSIHAPRIRYDLLRHLRRGDIWFHRQQSHVAFIQLVKSSVAEGIVWGSSVQLLDRWSSVRPHRKQTLLRTHFSEEPSLALAHHGWLGYLGFIGNYLQRCCFRACSRCTDLQLPYRHRCVSFRRMVHLWYCRILLAT